MDHKVTRVVEILPSEDRPPEMNLERYEKLYWIKVWSISNRWCLVHDPFLVTVLDRYVHTKLPGSMLSLREDFPEEADLLQQIATRLQDCVRRREELNGDPIRIREVIDPRGSHVELLQLPIVVTLSNPTAQRPIGTPGHSAPRVIKKGS
jgi:hypothetical protein